MKNINRIKINKAIISQIITIVGIIITFFSIIVTSINTKESIISTIKPYFSITTYDSKDDTARNKLYCNHFNYEMDGDRIPGTIIKTEIQNLGNGIMKDICGISLPEYVGIKEITNLNPHYSNSIGNNKDLVIVEGSKFRLDVIPLVEKNNKSEYLNYSIVFLYKDSNDHTYSSLLIFKLKKNGETYILDEKNLLPIPSQESNDYFIINSIENRVYKEVFNAYKRNEISLQDGIFINIPE